MQPSFLVSLVTRLPSQLAALFRFTAESVYIRFGHGDLDTAGRAVQFDFFGSGRERNRQLSQVIAVWADWQFARSPEHIGQLVVAKARPPYLTGVS